MNDRLFPTIRCGLNDLEFVVESLERSGLCARSWEYAKNELGGGRCWEIEFFNQEPGWSERTSKKLPWPVVEPRLKPENKQQEISV